LLKILIYEHFLTFVIVFSHCLEISPSQELSFKVK